MKNSNNDGFDQHYNAQVATDQSSLLIVAYALSNHATDQAEAEPTLDALPATLGTPPAGALDTDYFSAALSRISPSAANPITNIGRPTALLRQRRRRRTPARWSKWPTHSAPRWVRPCIACAHARSNR